MLPDSSKPVFDKFGAVQSQYEKYIVKTPVTIIVTGFHLKII